MIRRFLLLYLIGLLLERIPYIQSDNFVGYRGKTFNNFCFVLFYKRHCTKVLNTLVCTVKVLYHYLLITKMFENRSMFAFYRCFFSFLFIHDMSHFVTQAHIAHIDCLPCFYSYGEYASNAVVIKHVLQSIIWPNLDM